MNKSLPEQSLNISILLAPDVFLGKSFVTFAAAACVLLSPLPAIAVAADGAPVDAALMAPTADTAVQLQIEQRLRERTADADETTALFYLSRAWRPVWDDPARVEALVAAVEAIQVHGLDPADFSPERLRRASAEATTVEARAERELLLTDTLAALLFQLRHGKVDPRRLYREWNFTPPPNPYERAGALAAVLKYGQLGGAGFDVLTEEPPRHGNPLLSARLPNLIITPHMAWGSEEARNRLFDILVANINGFFAGKPQNIVV